MVVPSYAKVRDWRTFWRGEGPFPSHGRRSASINMVWSAGLSELVDSNCPGTGTCSRIELPLATHPTSVNRLSADKFGRCCTAAGLPCVQLTRPATTRPGGASSAAGRSNVVFDSFAPHKIKKSWVNGWSRPRSPSVTARTPAPGSRPQRSRPSRSATSSSAPCSASQPQPSTAWPA